MSVYHVLFNPLAANGHGRESAEEIRRFYPKDEIVLHNIMEISDYAKFFADIKAEDKVVLAGGDGALNRFVNAVDGISYPNSIYFYGSGTGNDFLRDLKYKPGEEPVCIDRYLTKLPKVTVNGKTYRYINGVGYGIDGYCCEVGDALKAKSSKPVNYTAIAIKGLLFHYKPTTAIVTVDGVRHEFKKAWLAPTMNGRFYGGGMMAAPKQNRLAPEHTQSVMLFYGKGKLKTLLVFPKIFSGEHIKKKDMVQILTGKHIIVEFDSPRALQIDGETIVGVTKYEVQA